MPWKTQLAAVRITRFVVLCMILDWKTRIEVFEKKGPDQRERLRIRAERT